MIVTMAHARTVPGFRPRGGFCVPGMRLWCEQHDIDFLDFVRNGIDDARLLATGDAFALALVEHARRCPEIAHGR